MRRLVATALFALSSLVLAAPAAAQETHRHSGNMRHVLNLPYEARNGTTPNYGTDIEFARLAGKQYALAGSYRNGMQIVDISRPERARIAAIYDCGVTQGDVQVFRRADLPGPHVRDLHVRHLRRRHVDVLPRGGGARLQRPQVQRHGQERHVHPRGHRPAEPEDALVRRGPAGLAQPDRAPERASTCTTRTRTSSPRRSRPSRSSTSPTCRRRGRSAELALPTRPGLGTESHDISFSKDGTRGYSAALSQGVIIDTRNPAAPQIITQLPRPGDQRLAPARAVHADRRDRPRARVPDRRGRVRRRGRHRPVPERRRARLRGVRRARARPAEGRLLQHRRGRPDRPAAAGRSLHRARLPTSTRTSRS